jgi:hypothetical protein
MAGVASTGSWIRHDHPIATAALGRVERRVGARQQHFRGCGGSWSQAWRVRPTRSRAGPSRCRSRGLPRPRGGAGVRQRRPRRARRCPAAADELLSAVARRDVGRPHAPAQDLGDPGQHLVADLVAVGVVHTLEVVDVEKNETQRRAIRALGCATSARRPDRSRPD